jgi:hypothetical protein
VIEVGRPDGSTWRPDPAVYQPVAAALRGGPLEVQELLSMPNLPPNHAVGPVELVGVLAGARLVTPYFDVTAQERAAADRLNALLEEDEEPHMSQGATLAVPAIRSGLTLSPPSYALYSELRRGLSPSADVLAERFIRRCQAAGGHPVIDGKSYENPDEARAAVTKDYVLKIEHLPTIWRSLGIV